MVVAGVGGWGSYPGDKYRFPLPFNKQALLQLGAHAENSTYSICLRNFQKLTDHHETHTQLEQQNTPSTPGACNPGVPALREEPLSSLPMAPLGRSCLGTFCKYFRGPYETQVEDLVRVMGAEHFANLECGWFSPHGRSGDPPPGLGHPWDTSVRPPASLHSRLSFAERCSHSICTSSTRGEGRQQEHFVFQHEKYHDKPLKYFPAFWYLRLKSFK